MSEVVVVSKKVKKFQRLMRIGQVAFAEGDYKEAHKSWQQAAMLQPDSEEVWIALLRVLTATDDRRVCLRNILTINPENKAAQNMLGEMTEIAQQTQAADDADVSVVKRSSSAVIQFMLHVMQSVLLGLMIAIAMLAVRFLLF